MQKLLADSRLVTLTGPGGVGKTRLAIEVASRTSEHFPDGAWLVDLAPIRETDLVARTIASALDVGISPDRAPIDALSEFVAARHLMVILDNCEHLLDPVASVVNELLSRSAQLVVLVTGREPLRTEGEVVWRVPVLSLPAEAAVGDLEEALTSDAVRLFVDRALSARPELCIDEADAQALAGVVRDLDGLPLAIELAATRLGVLGLRDLESRLARRLEFLSKGLRNAPARHQTLRATIEWSYQLLDEQGQLAFRCLSSFAASFSLDGATAVLGAEMTPGSAFEVLSDLVDKSLVVLIDTGHDSRYRLLETIREYAAGLLDSCDEGDAVRNRLLGWATALAEQAGESLWGDGTSAWLARLDLEIDNVREALRWAEGGGSVELGLRVCTALLWFWTGRGHVPEGRAWFRRLLGAASTAGGPVRTLAMAAAGSLANAQRLNAEAVALSEQAVAIAREGADPVALGWALVSLGKSLIPTKRFSDARAHLDEALALAEHTGQRRVVESALCSLTAVHVYSDNMRVGMKVAEQCVDLSRASGNLRVLSSALSGLGIMKRETGEYETAMALSREALACAHQMADVLAVDSAVRLIGECLLAQGEFEEARSYFEESLRLSDPGQPGWERWVAQGFLLLSIAHFEMGDFAAARGHAGQSFPADSRPRGRLAFRAVHDVARRHPGASRRRPTGCPRLSPKSATGKLLTIGGHLVPRGDRNHVHRLW